MYIFELLSFVLAGVLKVVGMALLAFTVIVVVTDHPATKLDSLLTNKAAVQAGIEAQSSVDTLPMG